MSGTRVRSLVFAGLFLLCSSPLSAQIVTYWPVIAISPNAASCGGGPAGCMGGLSYLEAAPSDFDAFVYPIAEGWNAVSECALAITWPADWSVQAELCAGTLVEGSLGNLSQGIRVLFNPCASSTTGFLHLRVNAPTVGRMRLGRWPNGLFAARSCGSATWEQYFVPDRGAYVDIGDVCGGHPMGDPCDYCTLHWGDTTPSATFDPSSLAITVRQGEVGTAPVQATIGGTQCQQIPECGGGWTQYCEGTGFASQSPWLALRDLGGGRFEAVVDARQLTPGHYIGGGEVEGGGCCQSNCWPVELTVTPPSAGVEDPTVLPATWGHIKAVYH